MSEVMALRVLVACRDRRILEDLTTGLADSGHEVFCAQDEQSARDVVSQAVPDVVFWGLLSEAEGASPCAVARELSACVIAIREADQETDTRQSPPSDCFDALALPCSDTELRLVMHRAAEWCRMQRELRLLRRELSLAVGNPPIVGASPAMIALLEAVEFAAGCRVCVLLRGERGTGKEALARAVHALSNRRRGPFVAVECKNKESDALLTEIFGGSAGAGPALPGSLMDANAGTLFLDDVDALPARGQERLLRVLQSEEITSPDLPKPRHVDVRVIAATTQDLRSVALAGEFLEELRERISSLDLAVPRLEERPEDIPLLVDYFTAHASRTLACPQPTLANEALASLVAYRWPGNIRELENVIEGAVLLARDGRISSRELPERFEDGEDASADFGLRRARKRLEVRQIRRALQQTGGNRTHAARLLEISHRALLYKLKEYGIVD